MTSATLIPTQTLTPSVHIASLVVYAQPAALSRVKGWLQTQAGVEIHGETSLGKLILVLETDQEQDILLFIDQLHAQPGVINAALIYHEILTEEHDAP